MAEETVGVANVKIKVDTSQFQAGVEAAKRQMKGLSSASEEVQKQYAGLTAAEKKTVSSLERQIHTLGLTKEGLTAYRIETKTTGAMQEYLRKELQKTSAALQTSTDKFDKYGKTSKEVQMALRGTPAQLTDIFVSLQGGQQPLTVLLQQGGQLRDMFGGVVPAVKALATTAVGLVNPITVAAAAVGTLGYAFYSGVKRQEAFSSKLIMAGSSARTTSGEMLSLVTAVGKSTGSFSGAEEALMQLAGQTKIAKENFALVAEAAVGMADVTGAEIGDTVAAFSKLADEPVKASIALNEQYHYLTEATLQRIQALEEQGRAEDAAALAQQAYASAMKERAEEAKSNLNALGRAFDWIETKASSAWRAITGAGQKSSIAEKLAKTNAAIAERDSSDQQMALLQATKKSLEEQFKAEQERQEAAEKTRRTEEARLWILQEEQKYESDQTKELKRHQAEIAKINRMAEQAGVSGDRLNALLGAENAKHSAAMAKFSGAKKSASSGGVRRSGANDALSAARASIQTQVEELNAAYKGGGMNSSDYFSKRRRLITRDMKLQLQYAGTSEKASSIREKSYAKLAKVDAEERQAITKRQSALLSYKQTLQDLLNTARTQYGREEQSTWLGSDALAYANGLNGVTDKVASERRTLQSDRDRQQSLGKWSSEDEQGYQQRLAALEEYQAQATELWNEHWQKLKAGEQDWTNGAKVSLQNYVDAEENWAEQTKTLFDDVFSGLEDSVVDFCTTGAGHFKDFAKSILTDMTRSYVKGAMSGIFKWAGGAIGGLFANAKGGVYGVPALSAYSSTIVDRPTLFPFAKGIGLMGEAGAEAIMPLTRGSDGRLGVQAQGAGIGGVAVTVNIQQGGAASTEVSSDQQNALGSQLGREIGVVVQREISNQMRPGGLLWKWQKGRV